MNRPQFEPTGEISLDGQLNLERMRRLLAETDLEAEVQEEIVRLAKVIEQLRFHKNALNEFIDYTQNA
jgi:hypothetical protein